MAFYETTFLTRQDISTQSVERLTKQFSSIITENNGTVLRTEYWGLRTISYIIKKNKKAHYVFMVIEAGENAKGAITEMERKMRLNEDLIRIMTIRTKEPSVEPSVMMTMQNNDEGTYTEEDGSRKNFKPRRSFSRERGEESGYNRDFKNRDEEYQPHSPQSE